MGNPYQVVRDFEAAVCEYTGAPYCVAVNSCTSALFLSLKCMTRFTVPKSIEIPQRTYVSVPMQILHAGMSVSFRDENWSGAYALKPFPIFDSARRFRARMYSDKECWDKRYCPATDWAMVCVSFHASKTLGDTQGGAILLANAEPYEWLKRARFDGRTEGIAPKDDNFSFVGWHCYMSPDVAARLTLKLHSLPDWNDDLPNDDYPDLSTWEIFK